MSDSSSTAAAGRAALGITSEPFEVTSEHLAANLSFGGDQAARPDGRRARARRSRRVRADLAPRERRLALAREDQLVLVGHQSASNGRILCTADPRAVPPQVLWQWVR
ncbi:MAG: hypothetical protein H7146_02120 [Burkholderiaceae bacterium]|nr:hypothetical protein [Microbacteriaceae bacterium]